MTILVVKTCDGDVYYRGDRAASRARAIDMATQQVCDYDTDRWDVDDVAIIRANASNRLGQNLYEKLVDMTVITVARVLE